MCAVWANAADISHVTRRVPAHVCFDVPFLLENYIISRWGSLSLRLFTYFIATIGTCSPSLSFSRVAYYCSRALLSYQSSNESCACNYPTYTVSLSFFNLPYIYAYTLSRALVVQKSLELTCAGMNHSLRQEHFALEIYYFHKADARLYRECILYKRAQ